MKGAKENKSVAESLNAIVKPHLVTMSEQYNVYAKAILEMEEKIKSLKFEQQRTGVLASMFFNSSIFLIRPFFDMFIDFLHLKSNKDHNF